MGRQVWGSLVAQINKLKEGVGFRYVVLLEVRLWCNSRWSDLE